MTAMTPPVQSASAAPNTGAMPARLGNALWRTLHTFADNYPDAPTVDTRRMAEMFLADFRDNLMTLNGANCGCRKVFGLLLKHCPPNLESPGGLRVWALAVHDFVNLKLGKPVHVPGLRHPVLSQALWKRILPLHPVPPLLQP